MLQIIIPAVEYGEMWDELNQMFVTIPPSKETTLQLEHSLISLSKWESKWHKPFFSNTDKTTEETIDYIRCMTVNRIDDAKVYNNIGDNNLKLIHDYIYDPMTATTVYDNGNGKQTKEIITSELIYYWMIAQNIPVEFEKWHINRLMTLIRVCAAKNSPPKKQNKQDIMRRNAELNAARRKKLNSKG